MTINPFEFRTVPSMQVAWGGAQRLGEILSGRFQARKALLITDAGLIKAGLIKPIADALAASGFNVTIFDKVVADPPEHIVADCVESARQIGVDIVIGLGGAHRSISPSSWLSFWFPTRRLPTCTVSAT